MSRLHSILTASLLCIGVGFFAQGSAIDELGGYLILIGTALLVVCANQWIRQDPHR